MTSATSDESPSTACASTSSRCDEKGYRERRRVFLEKIQRAASKAVAMEDPWSSENIPQRCPAERVIRHIYNHKTNHWTTDETIVKIQREPFTNGAMRHCYRMKKLATPPQHSSNHRFHRHGWSRALNYVAKAYLTEDGASIDTSQQAKDAVFNDVVLQYEAAHWAERFNDADPPRKINFIRAYAMEFPDRENAPIFAVERFIAGKDSYGAGFTKHNTNSGFVDLDLHRITPQVFSAYSFYASQGTRLVADIQGVGDLFTDPQVLSIDYRFGDGDLGPRGMALFFKTFRHCSFSDSMGIPIFKLSRNEKKHQAKYDDEESTLSDDSSIDSAQLMDPGLQCRFAKLDLNRQRRKSVLATPFDLNKSNIQLSENNIIIGNNNQTKRDDDTEKIANLSTMQKSVSKSIRSSLMMCKSKPSLHRSKSDVDEISQCLVIALNDPIYDHRAFHRLKSGELRRRSTHDDDDDKEGKENSEEEEFKQVGTPQTRRKTMMKKVSNPMMPTDETRANLGKVHYHLACLHGIGRFPEIIPDDDTFASSPDNGNNKKDDHKPTHDVFSVLFHLCHAASFRNTAACLALARVRAGLDTTVSDLLRNIVPIDFDSSKDLLQRAMESVRPPSGPKAAAGCLLVQILEDENTATDETMMNILEETIDFMDMEAEEAEEIAAQKVRNAKGKGVQPGDKVEANYALEGTYYPGVIVEVSDNKKSVVVQYDDDGSTETLTMDNVRSLEAATQTTAKDGPMSDAEALGFENMDEKCLFEGYRLKAKLAELKSRNGEEMEAARLFEEAADGAMNDGKMKTASQWSIRAAELQG